MVERWLGVTVSGDKATVVDAGVPPGGGPLTVHADFHVRLSKGDRAKAYRDFHQELGDYGRENGIVRAVVKGSAVSQMGKPTLAHFLAAELRGVAIAALADVCRTETITKQNITRTFGDRKADEYIKDAEFWDDRFAGDLRTGSREAAFCIIAVLNK